MSHDRELRSLRRRLLAAAREGGFRRVVLHRYFWHAGYPDEVERAGREAGIEAIATSFPSARHRATRPMIGAPSPFPEETMFVFFSSRNTPVDHFVHDKRWSGVWLREEMDAEPGAARRILPVPTYDTPDLPDFSDDPRWPNLVVKLTDWDGARFVKLARVRNADHAREVLGVHPSGGAPRAMRLDARTRVVNFFTRRGRAVYQPFIPYPTDREGRTFTHRLHLLVTPSDIRFLSAHNFVGPAPVPETVPFGLVTDDDPYVLSPRRGATYRLVVGPIEEELREAAQWIGLFVRRAVGKKFEVTRFGETE